MSVVKMFRIGLLAHIYLYRLNIDFVPMSWRVNILYLQRVAYIKFNICIAIKFLLGNA